ncbi:MAG: hypothetical protein WB809_08710 [Thermoplasmata archaeon]
MAYRCPFCANPPFTDREIARSHVRSAHPERVEERLALIPARTREHMVDPVAWAAGALLTE